MPNPHSVRKIKMADNGKEDITTKQENVQPIKVTLRAAIEKAEPPPNPQQGGGEFKGTVHPGLEASHNPQEDAPSAPPNVVSVNGYLTRVENSDRLRLELGKRPEPQTNPSAGQDSRTSSKSRYNVSVGPLTNSPAVKPASKGRRNDQRVPSRGSGRRSKSPMFSLVPVPSPMQVGPPPVASSSRPVVQPAPPPSQAKFGHQLPAMVTYQSGNIAVATEKRHPVADAHRPPPAPQPSHRPGPQPAQRPAKPSHRPDPQPTQRPLQRPGPQPPQRPGPQHSQRPGPQPQRLGPQQPQRPAAPQQSFPVDPSFNLCMAVECHRATGQDEDGDTPLHIALAQEFVDVRLVRRLVELFKLAGKPLDVFNDMQQTPLHIAAITGNPDAARILVENGSNANETDRNGQTAMHNVCSNPCQGSRDTLDAIIRFTKVKLDLDTRNYCGLGPLHISVKHNLLHLSKVLIDGGANTNAVDAKSGWTPLFHAVTNQDPEHVQILLCAGAQVNMQSYSGNTALHVATGRGFTEIVRLLMRYGADMSLRNTHKDTPGMVAQDNNQMSNILRGVSSSPSVGSNPHYSSPSSHPHPMTNGMALKPSPTPSQNYQVMSQTALPLGKHGDNTGKKPRATRKDKGSRRGSNAAKNEASSSNPGTPTTTASSSVASDGSGMSQDESDAVVPTSHRVSVIVEPKSVKRRFLEQNEKDQQERHSKTPSPRGDKMTHNKKMKINLEAGAALPQSIPKLHDSGSATVDQSEPMDLTKGKTKDAVVIVKQKKEVVTNGQTSTAPILADKVKDELKPEQRSIPNGDAMANPLSLSHKNDVVGKGGTVKTAEMVDELPKTLDRDEEKMDLVEAEKDVAKTEDKVSDVSTPKKERKRKKSDRLPPKKRK
ncbi:ankycorbin-like isoform X1 [Asterias rubens]|uniref:ankycorbin-like isoform X1 n=1 Tax=Asterias rubens TaxID=7604 RepID=UPI001455D2FD|nr:ankycorbin-like isoform X1 [Asterias rubens]